MIPLPVRYRGLVSVRTKRAWATAVGLLALLGLAWADSVAQFVAFILVLFAAVLPSALWIRRGALGIPIWPVIALVYIPYFGWPILSGNEIIVEYTESEILDAALTVGLFLFMATIAWRLIANKVGSQNAISPDVVDTSRVVELTLVGLLIGIMFHIGIVAGWLGWLGTFFGVARSVAITFATVACFLVGVTRGQGVLRGQAWIASIAGVVLLIILSWSSLFLVGGVAFFLAPLFGYVIIAKRVPWLMVGAALVAVTVLHAGKAEMRTKYWETGTNYGGLPSVMELPAFTGEWVADGISAMVTGSVGQSALDRTSLVQMVLRVQRDTPGRIDYLRGETYLFLPAILVPRFIESDKPASQIGMDLLNIRYGLIDADVATSTAIGWGLVAEAYANFGYLGVIGIALLLGALCGMLENWNKNAATISLPAAMNIVVMMTLIHIELDFIQLCSTFFQSFVAVLIFLTAFKLFAIRHYPGTGSAGR